MSTLTQVGPSALAGGLSLWLLLLILNQFQSGPIRRVASYLDPFRLLGIFTFFGPRPGCSDYYLLIRDRTADGCQGEWTLVPTIEPRAVSDLLWAPSKRLNKSVMDLVNHLKRQDWPEDLNTDLLAFQLPYLVVLNYVSGLPRSAPDRHLRQFMIVEQPGSFSDEQPRIILRSKYHELDT